MPLKVLNISSGNLYGGVETLLATLARESHNTPDILRHFALCFEGRLSSELRQLHAPLIMFKEIRVRYPWTIWRARRQLARLLQKERYDAVYCHMSWTLAVFGPTVRRFGIPLILFMHDAAHGKTWVERWASHTPPNLVLCNSEFTATTLPKLYPRRQPPYEVIHHPISDPAPVLSAKDRLKLRASLDTAPDSCVIIQVGRMEPYKGHTLHLDALAFLKDLPGWTCWIVGGVQRPHEISYLEELKTRAKNAGIAHRIRFLGERRDIPLLLRAADIFCQPNLAPEPFGIVFIEALYAGLPILTTRLGGPMEIVDETTGRLVFPESFSALAAALRLWISDPALRQELGRNGPARAATLCSPARSLHRHQEVLFHLLNRESPARAN